jgi:uridine kinase
MGKPFVIGVAGGTGSGKTTFTKNILQALKSHHVAVIQHDWYYRDRSGIPEDERAAINYDHPNALETPLLIKHLKALKAGRPVSPPRYNFVTHTRMQVGEVVNPTPVIIVEGILIFVDEAMRSLFDLMIFVQTEADLRLLRRLQRDLSERGRSFESAVAQYLTTVRPMHEMFVEPSKEHADIIVPASRDNQKAIRMIVDLIHRQADRTRRTKQRKAKTWGEAT